MTPITEEQRLAIYRRKLPCKEHGTPVWICGCPLDESARPPSIMAGPQIRTDSYKGKR